MPISEAKKRSNAAYTAKCDYINIRPLKEDGETIRAAAKAAGKSLQGYILDAVRAKMAADAAGAVLVAIPRAQIEAEAARAGKTPDAYMAELAQGLHPLEGQNP